MPVRETSRCQVDGLRDEGGKHHPHGDSLPVPVGAVVTARGLQRVPQRVAVVQMMPDAGVELVSRDKTGFLGRAVCDHFAQPRRGRRRCRSRILAESRTPGLLCDEAVLGDLGQP